MEQRSQEWHEIRRGRFTASEIYKLIGTGKTPSKCGVTLSDWSDTAQNYIMLKVAQSFSEQEHEISTVETRWGIEHEPIARSYYEGVFKEEVEEIGFVLWPENASAGCSPDGIVVGKNRIIEIKCPYNLNNHVEAFFIKDNATFKLYKPQYFWQVQCQLLITGYGSCDFVSYHPFFKSDKRLSCIEILPDKEAFEILKDRIYKATAVRDELIAEIQS